MANNIDRRAPSWFYLNPSGSESSSEEGTWQICTVGRQQNLPLNSHIDNSGIGSSNPDQHGDASQPYHQRKKDLNDRNFDAIWLQTEDLRQRHQQTVLALFMEELSTGVLFDQHAEYASELLDMNLESFNSYNKAIGFQFNSPKYYLPIPREDWAVSLATLLLEGQKVAVYTASKIDECDFELDGIYSRGTFRHWFNKEYPLPTDSSDSTKAAKTDAAEGFILCMVQQESFNDQGLQTSTTAFVALHNSTGDIFYEEFEDDQNQGLDARLQILRPVEILSIDGPTQATKANLIRYANSHRHVSGTCPKLDRILNYSEATGDSKAALERYCSRLPELGVDSRAIQSMLENLPNSVWKCIFALWERLGDSGLTPLLRVPGVFQNYGQSFYMAVDRLGFESLKLFPEESNPLGLDNLYAILNSQISTKSGARELRAWLARPLLNAKDIQHRLDAVNEVRPKQIRMSISRILSQGGLDVTGCLASIYLKRYSRVDILEFLRYLLKIMNWFKTTQFVFKSPLLFRLKSDLIMAQPMFQNFLDQVNPHFKQGSKADDFFLEPDSSARAISTVNEIVALEKEQTDLLEKLRADTGINTLEYASLHGSDPLILSKSLLDPEPESWKRIENESSRSLAQSTLYRVSEVDAITARFKAQCNALSDTTEQQFDDFLHEIGKHYEVLRRVAHGIARLDCILSLASVASEYGWIMPEVTDYPTPMVRLESGDHQILERLPENRMEPDPTMSVKRASIMKSLHDLGRAKSSLPGPREILVTRSGPKDKATTEREHIYHMILAQIGSFVPGKYRT